MKYEVLILCLLSTIFLNAQSNKCVKKQKDVPLSQLIKGRWQAEDDANVILKFDKKYIEFYGKDTADNLEYMLSYTPNLNGKIPADISKLDSGKNIFIVLYANGVVDRYYELLGLGEQNLSWMYYRNGKIFVYKRM